MKLYCKALSPKIGREIPAPYYASPGAAAMDLHACTDEAVTIPAGGRAVIPTGIAIALPSPDYVALIFARSGLGIKHGVAPANCVGVIDSDYRGEIQVGLQNSSDVPYTIQPGDRIAQLPSSPSFRQSWNGLTLWTPQNAAPAALALRDGDARGLCPLDPHQPFVKGWTENFYCAARTFYMRRTKTLTFVSVRDFLCDL